MAEATPTRKPYDLVNGVRVSLPSGHVWIERQVGIDRARCRGGRRRYSEDTKIPLIVSTCPHRDGRTVDQGTGLHLCVVRISAVSYEGLCLHVDGVCAVRCR